jgi:hypothetical protein
MDYVGGKEEDVKVLKSGGGCVERSYLSAILPERIGRAAPRDFFVGKGSLQICNHLLTRSGNDTQSRSVNAARMERGPEGKHGLCVQVDTGVRAVLADRQDRLIVEAGLNQQAPDEPQQTRRGEVSLKNEICVSVEGIWPDIAAVESSALVGGKSANAAQLIPPVEVVEGIEIAGGNIRRDRLPEQNHPMSINALHLPDRCGFVAKVQPQIEILHCLDSAMAYSGRASRLRA